MNYKLLRESVPYSDYHLLGSAAALQTGHILKAGELQVKFYKDRNYTEL